MKNLYTDIDQINKDTFLETVASDVISSMCKAIIDSSHEIEDYDWLLKQYIALSSHENLEVRGAVITSIGHLARINPQASKTGLLQLLRRIPVSAELDGRIKDAVDDINMFL